MNFYRTFVRFSSSTADAVPLLRWRRLIFITARTGAHPVYKVNSHATLPCGWTFTSQPHVTFIGGRNSTDSVGENCVLPQRTPKSVRKRDVEGAVPYHVVGLRYPSTCTSPLSLHDCPCPNFAFCILPFAFFSPLLFVKNVKNL